MRHLMQKTLLTVSALALAALLSPDSAAAQAMDTYGMGARSQAMGGAVTADVEDFSANYYNPAGIVRSGQTRVGAGWFGAVHDMRLDGVNSNVDPAHGTVIGLNIPGEVDGFRFGFGLGVHLNDQRVSRSRTLPRQQPRWELYDNRPHRTYLATHLAIQPWEWLRIGGGISFLSTSAASLGLRGNIDITAPEQRSRLEQEFTGELLTIRYPQVGVQVNPFSWLDFGVVYRGEFGLTNDLEAELGECRTVGADGNCNGASTVGGDTLTISAGDGIPPIPGYLQLATASVNAYVPHQLSFAASVEPIENTLRISAEVTWLMWSRYESPVGSSDTVLIIDVPPELQDTIMVPDSITAGRPVAAEFNDRVVPRIGVEWTPVRNTDLQLDVRAGYFYENSPAPEQTGFTNLVDTDRHAWSLGFGVDLFGLRPVLPGFLSIDVYAQYGFLPSRTMQKTSPIDPIGDYTAEGHIFAGGVTIEAGFE